MKNLQAPTSCDIQIRSYMLSARRQKYQANPFNDQTACGFALLRVANTP